MKIIYLSRWVENDRLYWEIETNISLSQFAYAKTTFYYNDSSESAKTEKDQILKITKINGNTLVGYNYIAKDSIISDRWEVNVLGVKSISIFTEEESVEQTINDFNIEGLNNTVEDYVSNGVVEEKNYTWYSQEDENTKYLQNQSFETNTLLFEKSIVFEFISNLEVKVINPSDPISITEEEFVKYQQPGEENIEHSFMLYYIEELKSYKVLYNNGVNSLVVDCGDDIYQWEELYTGLPYSKLSKNEEENRFTISYDFFWNREGILVLEEFKDTEEYISKIPTTEILYNNNEKHNTLEDVLPVTGYMYQQIIEE